PPLPTPFPYTTLFRSLYGWEGAFPPASLEQLMSDDDAQQFGTGGLYAAPGALSVLGVYYNQDMLADAGVADAPTTLDEFSEAMRSEEHTSELQSRFDL